MEKCKPPPELAPPLVKRRWSGEEPFRHKGGTLPLSVKDVSAWSSSDLMSNKLRGRVAEFLVAQALAVNLAGSMAMFLVETFETRVGGKGSG